MTHDASLRPTDLMPLINIAWSKSFARIKQNKKAILERGWNPLNYNLITNQDLRATMTIAEKLTESSKVTLPLSMRPVCASTNTDDNPDNSTTTSPSISHQSHAANTQQSSLNFSTGVSAECLTALVRNEQLMEARERIRTEKADGEDLASRLKKAKRVTAGFCWKEGTNRLGKTIFEICKEKQLVKKREAQQKKQKEQNAYLALKEKADAILSTGQAVEKYSNKDLSIILRSLKRDGDNKIPSKKSEMIQLFNEWKNREPLVFQNDDDSIDEQPQIDNDINDEAQIVEI